MPILPLLKASCDLSRFENMMDEGKLASFELISRRFIQMIDIERIYQQAFPAVLLPIPTLHSARDKLITRALLWRDRLGTRPELTKIHPAKVSDEVLIAAISRMCGFACNIVTRTSPMAIMDAAIITLLEGSQQWPTSEMNPLGYDFSPKGFIQPSYEEFGLGLSDSKFTMGFS